MPKTHNSGKDNLDATLASTVIAFNDDIVGLSRALNHLEIEPKLFERDKVQQMPKKFKKIWQSSNKSKIMSED